MAGVLHRMRATLRVAAHVFGNPALRWLELAFLAFNTVEYGSWVAILLYAYEATGPASVGVVALVQLVPASLAAPLASTLGDRYPRHRVLLAAYLLLTLLTGATAAAMLAGWPAPVVYLSAVGASMALTIVRPSHNALLPSLALTPEELTAANAVSSIGEAGGLLLGPLSAAAVLTVATPGSVLALLTAGSGVAVILVAAVRPLAARTVVAAGIFGAGGVSIGQARESPGVRVLAGFRALAVDGDARLIVAVLAARTLMIGVTDVLFVLLALELFGTGDSGAALLSAALGVGGVIGGGAAFLLVGQRRIAPVLLASAVAWGVAFAVMGVTASGTLAPLFLVLGGIGLSVMDVAGRTILQRAVRDEVLSRVFGILEALIMAALAAGAVLVPAVVAIAGLVGSVIVFAALLPLALALAWPGLRGLDRRAAAPARALALLRRLRLFEALDPPAMEVLGRAPTWVTVPAGAVVIREGDAGDRFYVLESGSVSIARGGLPIRTLASPGDGFGEIALLRNVPRTATVIAEEPSVLLVLGRDAFLAAVTGHPVVGADALRIVDAHLEADRRSSPA